jgi:hypothetical protein
MKQWIYGRMKWLPALAVPLPLALNAQQPAPPPAADTSPIESKAVRILKASCDTLAGAKAISFTALNTYDKVARNGQPLYYTTLDQVTLQRPDKLRVIIPGDSVPDEIYCDGKTAEFGPRSSNTSQGFEAITSANGK